MWLSEPQNICRNLTVYRNWLQNVIMKFCYSSNLISSLVFSQDANNNNPCCGVKQNPVGTRTPQLEKRDRISTCKFAGIIGHRPSSANWDLPLCRRRRFHPRRSERSWDRKMRIWCRLRSKWRTRTERTGHGLVVATVLIQPAKNTVKL